MVISIHLIGLGLHSLQDDKRCYQLRKGTFPFPTFRSRRVKREKKIGVDCNRHFPFFSFNYGTKAFQLTQSNAFLTDSGRDT